MIYCPKCGRQNPDGAKFCQGCGESLDAAAEAVRGSRGDGEKRGKDRKSGRGEEEASSRSGKGKSSRAKTSPASGKQPKKKNKKSSGKKTGAMIAAAVVLVIILGALVGVLFFGGSEETAEVAEDEDEFVAYYQEIDPDTVAESEDGMHYVEGQLLIVTEESVSFSEVESYLKDYNGEIVGYLSFTNDYQVQFEGDYTYGELNDLCEELGEEDLFDTVTLSYVEELTADSVDYTLDPWINADKASDSSGSVWDEDDPDGLNWWAEAISMVSVWETDLELTTVKVGIIDSMFDVDNEDLDEGLFAELWYNPEDSDGNCTVTDLYNDAVDSGEDDLSSYYHGTHVAGLIAAQAENSFGIAGVNQSVELYGYAMHSEEHGNSSEGFWSGSFTWKYAISLMLNEGVKVINISMGYDTPTKKAAAGTEWAVTYIDQMSSQLSDFLMKYVDAGYEFLICKSAGNNSVDASWDFLGAITEEEVAERIIIVGAAENQNGYYTEASFSNTGSRVDLYAPGVDILSDYPTNVTATLSGTSMASPIVAGVASLIWSVNPDLSASQVRSILIASTSVTAFQEESQSFLESLIQNFTGDLVSIVDAGFCVQLALSVEGTAVEEALSYGTVTGMIYSLDENGDLEADTITDCVITVYDSSGNWIAESDSETAGYYSTEESFFGLKKTYTNWSLQSYTLLLEPGTYTIVVTADGFAEQSQTVTVGANETIQCDFELIEEDTALTASELYSILSQYTFDFSSGVGAWATSLHIEEDGTFSGQFYDEDSGAGGSGYSSQVYVCNFSGSLGDPVLNEDGSYTLPLDSLVYEEEEGRSYIVNETLYEFSTAYGLEGTDSLVLYLTGTEEADLPSGLVGWCSSHDALSDGVLVKYAIYNASEEAAFFGETYSGSSITVPDETEAETTEVETTTEAETSTEEETTAVDAVMPTDRVSWGGHLYYLFDLDEVTTGAEASAYCEALGGYLASITSAEENDFLYSYITSLGYTSAYFGLSDSETEGTWVWLNGETVSYTNWHSGEPNSENSGEDYAMFYYKYSDGTWNDGDFGNRTNGGGRAFLCEWDG